MTRPIVTAVLCCFAAMAFLLSGCGGSKNDANAAASASRSATISSGGSSAMFNIAKGPDVCFRAVEKHLDAAVKVSEILSVFSVGADIDSSATEPVGDLTLCTAQYQSPQDPRKLLGITLDTKTGVFSPPAPVEISISSSDAAAFKLEDYLMPLSQVNAAELKTIMEAQKPRLKSVYGRYAWLTVRLSPPNSSNNAHTLRLDLEGRLATNDVKSNGFATITTDGKKIIFDNLLP